MRAKPIGFVSALNYEFLPCLLRDFRAAKPDVHLVLYDLVPSEQIEALEAGRIDRKSSHEFHELH